MPRLHNPIQPTSSPDPYPPTPLSLTPISQIPTSFLQKPIKNPSHIHGAYSLFSVYPGADRSEPHAERHELPGTLIGQARRLVELLDVQSYVAFDKTNRTDPNAVKYPPQALHEAMVNALAHRDYEIVEPTRITVFADRIEVLSPGSVPTGVNVDEFRAGRAPAKWRNQSLAWFLNRLQLAQAEGQGIPTILRSMREEGSPPPLFQVNEVNVVCVLPAHPRHALAREHRTIEEAISLGALEHARKTVLRLLAQDPKNIRTVQLFAEVQRALNSPDPVREYLTTHKIELGSLPPIVLIQLADVLSLTNTPTPEDFSTARRLYLEAAKGRLAEREVQQVAVGLSRAGDNSAALQFLYLHPELNSSPSILRIRANVLISEAKHCSQTAQRQELSPETRKRASNDFRQNLKLAEQELLVATSLTTDTTLLEDIRKSLDLVEQLKKTATRLIRPR